MDIYHLALYIIFGILPSLTWLAYYLRKDLHPELKRTILKIFLWGALVTLPVFFAQIGLAFFLNKINMPPILFSLIYWFLVIALTEEFFKYLVVTGEVLLSHEFDEPLDAMLYMVIVALGFAALENVLYLFSPADSLSFNDVLSRTLAVSFVRFIGATFLHTLCSATIGYFLALSIADAKKRFWLIFSGIFIATFLHGLYDFSIMIFAGAFQFAVPVVILLSLAIFVIWAFNKTKRMKSICKIN